MHKNGMAPLGRAWFRPRRYGLGAAPSTRQGWALTGGEDD